MYLLLFHSSQGELQYRERLQEITVLKTALQDCQRELRIRSNDAATVDAMKSEIRHLQRELLQERVKSKALAEELENPLNVHRY